MAVIVGYGVLVVPCYYLHPYRFQIESTRNSDTGVVSPFIVPPVPVLEIELMRNIKLGFIYYV